MKNPQKRFISIIVTLVVMGGALYLHSTQKTSVDVADTQAGMKGTTTSNLPDAFFKLAAKNPNSKVLAKGDVNSDGYEDAVIQETYCGASCSVSLQVILNEKNTTAKLLKDKNYPDTFSPAFQASSAVKSEVTNVSIKNGVISLTGKGLACTAPNSDEICTEEKWNVVKTATYKFDGLDIVQLSVK